MYNESCSALLVKSVQSNSCYVLPHGTEIRLLISKLCVLLQEVELMWSIAYNFCVISIVASDADDCVLSGVLAHQSEDLL